MPLETKYSPLVFSPRPAVVGNPFELMPPHRCGTAKGGKFSYVVSSDGIEVNHPEVKRWRGSSGQVIADREDLSLYSRTQDAGGEDVATHIGDICLDSRTQGRSITPLAGCKTPLHERRGKRLAHLDLDVYCMLEERRSTRDEGSLASDGRPTNFPPIGEEYEIIKKIGENAEGVCTLVEQRTNSELRVIKSVCYPKLIRGKPIEAKILHDLLGKHNKNIIQLHSYEFIQQPDFELVQYRLEYCSGGDLLDLVVRYDEHNARFPEAFIWKVFSQLLSALESLHRGFEQRTGNGIVHRDVKPENIFIRRPRNSQDYPDVVLADFGSASLDFATYEPAGTFIWQPPEIPRKTPKADVYAAGGVIHYMIHLTPPMLPLPAHITPTERNEERWQMRAASRQPIRTVPEMYSEQLIDMMLIALEPEECRRMNAHWLLSVVESIMGQKPAPGTEKSMDAKPLAVWAFERDPPGRKANVRRSRSDEDDGYTQYMEMMGDMYE